jgi:hypothetical protein
MLALALVFLGVLVVAWVLVVPRFMMMFADMGTKLPAVTAAVVSIRPVIALLGALGVAGLMVAKQFLLPDRANLWINVAFLLVVLLACMFLVVAMFAPLFGLMQAVQGQSGS